MLVKSALCTMRGETGHDQARSDMRHAFRGSVPASSSSRWNHVKFDFVVQCLGVYRCSVTIYDCSWYITCIHSRLPYSQHNRCTPHIRFQLVAYCSSIQCVQQHCLCFTWLYGACVGIPCAIYTVGAIALVLGFRNGLLASGMLGGPVVWKGGNWNGVGSSISTRALNIGLTSIILLDHLAFA